MNILEMSGLDTIPYIFREWKEEEPDISLRSARLLARKISKSHQDLAISYCKTEIDRLDGTASTVQTKAATLMGATGITASFVVGFSGLLIKDISTMGNSSLWLFTILFTLLVLGLGLTAIFALKTTSVASYTYPSIKDVEILAKEGETAFKQEYLATLYYSARKFRVAANVKTTFLLWSQIWFRNSIVLLLLVGLSLAGNILFIGNGTDPTSNGVTPAPTITSPVTPSATETPKLFIPYPPVQP